MAPTRVQPGDGLPDDQQPQRRRHEQEHRQQPQPGASRFLADPRPDHSPRGAEPGDHHPQGNQGKCAQPLQREQEVEYPRPR